MDHATVKAPLEGTVGKVQIAKGSIVKAGMVALPLVDTSSYWVDANFKETDLERIKPGQPATVTVDLAPSETLRGKVDAISPASVSAFSLLPPENATGSWVKVTQRFPVSISIPSAADHPELRIGASATVTVDTSGLASASK